VIELEDGESDGTDGVKDVVGGVGSLKVSGGGRTDDGEICDEVIQVPFRHCFRLEIQN
jgi:hypothetical protein